MVIGSDTELLEVSVSYLSLIGLSYIVVMIAVSVSFKDNDSEFKLRIKISADSLSHGWIGGSYFVVDYFNTIGPLFL